MSIAGLMLLQMGTNKKLWSTRWDTRSSAWEQVVLSESYTWPETWTEESYFGSSFGKGVGLVVYTALDDVVLLANGDEETGELKLQCYLEQVVHILKGMKKKEVVLSRAILEDYPTYSVALYNTVSHGGCIAYTVLPDE